MIVAVAGHVDHGKTSLVRALTGTDTDTLAEERRRAMTIEVGFASADLEGGALTAFVDLPGHERFIRNLLAGIVAIDVALLVVAADDGPMPQTLEHLAVLQLLGVARIAVVLTKVDRVPEERGFTAGHEVAALLAAGPFAGAPVFPVVATVGTGVAALRRHLVDVSRSLPARDPGGQFRLAIDRSFTVAGAGRVVTGAVLSGRVEVGDRLVVSPPGASVRVRGLQAQGRPFDCAVAGERIAVNIVGSSEWRATDTARGAWLVAAPAHAPSVRLDVWLEVPAGAPRALVCRGALLLHIGAAAVSVRLVVLFATAIQAGGSGHAQLLLDEPVAAVQADRFILRDPAADFSVVAGGQVVDPFAPARGRQRPHRAALLAAMALPASLDALRQLLDHAPGGVDLLWFARCRNLTQPEAAAVVLRALAVEVTVDGRDGGRWGLAPVHWQALRDRVRDTIAAWHVEQPESLGPSEAALVERLRSMRGGGRDKHIDAQDRNLSGAPLAALLQAAVGSLVAEGVVSRNGLRCRLADHRAELSPADVLLLARVTERLEAAGLRPPIVGAVATDLDLPLPELLEGLGRLARHGALVRVAPNRYFTPSTVARLADQARRLSAESPDSGQFDAAAYRDRTGIGRNLTVQVLEFLDREGVTRFDGTWRRALTSPVDRAGREPAG